MVRSFTKALALSALAGIAMATSAFAQATNDHTVLILGETVTGGSSSLEAVAAANLGYDVHVVTDAQWAAMTAADFATYRAIVMGDPTCVYSEAPIDAALANNSTWGGVVDGNVVVIGTDPVYHATYYDSAEELAGAQALITKAMAFVLSVPTSADRTSLYVSLSCYWDGEDVSLPLLDYVGDGGFAIEHTSCHNDAHITAFHPALDGLTDGDLSNWGCSVHSVFTAWDDTNFEVLAIGDNLGDSYSDEDGSTGSPYILALGVCNELPTISVSLDPTSFWPPNNQMATVNATISTTGSNVTVELVSITSDEGDEANDVSGADMGTDDRSFSLRKQRDGNGDGRVYTVTYRATDDCGHEVEASATVTVAHSQGN
jgi:hypothetical protein